MYNTIVIGAGPVGSYLAGKLTRLGYKVLVLEKKQTAGQNICCTGVISKECYDLLDITENVAIRQVNSAKFFAPSGRYLRLWRDDKVAIITDRPALEQTLVKKAQSIGTDYSFNTKVTSIESTADRLSIRANSNNVEKVFETETAVITTGYGSYLPKNLGLGRIGHVSIGAQAEIATNQIDEVEIYFDQQVAPGGFAWFVPTNKRKGLAGLITSHQAERYLSQFLLKLKAQDKIISVEANKNYARIPLQPLPKTYTDRLLVVGEAAGQVKSITGGGIYYGILCANIAATVLHQAFDSGDLSAAKLSTYQKQWLARLRWELTIGYWTQRLWSKLSNNHIEYLFTIAQKRHIPERMKTTEHFSFDWHSQLLLQAVHSLLPFAKS